MLGQEWGLRNAGNRAVWKEIKLPPWENKNIYDKDNKKQILKNPQRYKENELWIAWTTWGYSYYYFRSSMCAKKMQELINIIKVIQNARDHLEL